MGNEGKMKGMAGQTVPMKVSLSARLGVLLVSGVL